MTKTAELFLARARAAVAGETFYIGPRCPRCSTQRRYVTSGGCVECKLRGSRERRAAHRAAAADSLAATPGDWLTLAECARIAGVTLKTVRNWIAREGLSTSSRPAASGPPRTLVARGDLERIVATAFSA